MRKSAVITAILHIFVGIFFLALCVVGTYLIETENLTSYSDLFFEHRAVFMFVLLLIGTVLLSIRAEVGAGFIGLAIFASGNIHDYVTSPLVIVLMITYYVRHREWLWLSLQTIAGVVQGICYVYLWTPDFHITETAGFLIGAGFFIYRGIKIARRGA